VAEPTHRPPSLQAIKKPWGIFTRNAAAQADRGQAPHRAVASAPRAASRAVSEFVDIAELHCSIEAGSFEAAVS